jgi:two-component system, chemotaxis family, sensor kinase Cph1
VQSLVAMTKADDVKSFKSTLCGRIQALARAHDLLSRSRWRGADLRAIAEEELGAYAAERGTDIIIDGPRTVLSPSAIQALAMTLHELATNAAKHGALSVPEGRLRLAWQVPRDGAMLEIQWEENMDPSRFVRPVDRKAGFGSRLIGMMVESQLDGHLEMEWTDHGLLCRMRVPKALLLCPPTSDPSDAETHRVAPLPRAGGTGARILLVEDEVLVAAEITMRLEGAGHVVAATASSLRAAEAAATKADIDAALLDVNLGGELSFPVADLLVARGLPFVFVTGYQPDGLIPDRFNSAPVVRKPSPPDVLERALAEALSAAGRDHDPILKAS